MPYAKQVGVMLYPAQIEKLDRVAAALGITRSALLRAMVDGMVDDVKPRV